MKAVHYTADAARALKRHANMAARIMTVVQEYARGDGAHANQVIAPKGSSALRLRVGDFRVIFEETETSLTITAVGPRGNIYD